MTLLAGNALDRRQERRLLRVHREYHVVMSADLERLVDELEKRLAHRFWSVSRGPHQVTISTSSSVGAPGFNGWSMTGITARNDPAAGVWIITETILVSTSDTGDTSYERELGRFASAEAAIQFVERRAS